MSSIVRERGARHEGTARRYVTHWGFVCVLSRLVCHMPYAMRHAPCAMRHARQLENIGQSVCCDLGSDLNRGVSLSLFWLVCFLALRFGCDS